MLIDTCAELLATPPIVIDIGRSPGDAFGTRMLACPNPTNPGANPRNEMVAGKPPMNAECDNVALARGDNGAAAPSCGVLSSGPIPVK